MITLDTLKDRVYDLHLTEEQKEQVIDIIDTAYALGGEVGYDTATRNFLPKILELMGSVGK